MRKDTYSIMTPGWYAPESHEDHRVDQMPARNDKDDAAMFTGLEVARPQCSVTWRAAGTLRKSPGPANDSTPSSPRMPRQPMMEMDPG